MAVVPASPASAASPMRSASGCCCRTRPTPKSRGSRPVSARSALALMAAGENKWLQVGDGDVVVLSSHAIPGNEHNVNKVIDGLWRLGAEVVHAGLADVHVTGHGQQGELKTMLSVARPEFF